MCSQPFRFVKMLTFTLSHLFKNIKSVKTLSLIRIPSKARTLGFSAQRVGGLV